MRCSGFPVQGKILVMELWSHGVELGGVAHHVWRESGLEVEEHSDCWDLLQPFVADLLAVVLIFSVVVEAKVERPEHLFGKCAQCTHKGLAENRIPTQLQLCVWERETEMKR